MQKKQYFCAVMPKKTILHIIEWAVALAACAYLAWRLATYEDYAALGECLRSMAWPQWLALVLCVALVPVNMALEAWRWMTLVPMSWRDAQRQVYYSKLAGVITPWRLGEYPARALMQGEWKQTLSMGAVGSATMTLAIILAGAVGLAFSPTVFDLLGGSYLYSVGLVAVAIGVLFALMPKLLKRWTTITQELLLRSIGQSLVRLVCWCVQLGLVLFALGAIGGLADEGMSGLVAKTFVYYLLVTITPNVPVVEVGVRGAWAIFLFGTANAALAGVLLWVINTLLPCVLWLFIRKKE